MGRTCSPLYSHLKVFLGSYEYSNNNLLFPLVTIFRYYTSPSLKTQFCAGMCLGQAPLESYRIAVQRSKCWTLACFVSFWSLVEPQVCLLPSNLLFILCEELRGKWKRKKHEEIGQVNRLCTVIFNTPLLLFKACCCFYLAALLPSSKPNLVQASLGGPLYWILVSQGVFLPASVCSWDKRKRRGEALLPFCIGYWSDLLPSGDQILLWGWLTPVAASMTSWHSLTGVILHSGAITCLFHSK